uniref:Uncharacterized protein n=1 Tax=Timema cristinae TaxID=61476 RepID=A0A7R9CM20_TIMCR|nr:unnamed protein product [Timema cristinae]
MERKYNYWNIPPIVFWWVQVLSHEKIQIKKSFRKDNEELLSIFRASLALRPLGAPTKNCVSSSSSIVLRDWVCGVHMVMYSEFSAFIPLYV